MSDITAPAANTWNVAAIAAGAIAVLRLEGAGDPDVDRVETAAVVATGLLDAELDADVAVDATTNAVLATAAVQVTVELYRRKDLPFGTGGAWSPNETPYSVEGDPVAGVRAMTLPWKQRWGLA